MYPTHWYRLLARVLVTAALAQGASGYAQIPAGSGTRQPDSRAAPMGPQNDLQQPEVLESNKPQSKDAAATNRGVKSGDQKQSHGAGGFNNGLYGTGTGSTK